MLYILIFIVAVADGLVLATLGADASTWQFWLSVIVNGAAIDLSREL